MARRTDPPRPAGPDRHLAHGVGPHAVDPVDAQRPPPVQAGSPRRLDEPAEPADHDDLAGRDHAPAGGRRQRDRRCRSPTTNDCRDLFFMAGAPHSRRGADSAADSVARSAGGPCDKSLSNGLDDDSTTVVWPSKIERYDSSVRRNSKNLGSRAWASLSTRVASAWALPRIRSASASAWARIVSRSRSAWLVIVTYCASPSARSPGRDLPALAADQLEHGRAHLDRDD